MFNKKTKIASFLIGAEDSKIKRFKKRKDIEILNITHTTEINYFRICHIEYIDLEVVKCCTK